MSFLISTALEVAATAPAPAQGSLLGTLFPAIGIMAFFYFFILRPQNKRAKEHRELLAALSKGDEVVTNGGLLGKVVRVSDEFVAIEIADNTEIKVQKIAIASVLPKGTLKAI